MAGIDKIYGTTEEYDIFYAWCEEELPEATNFFYPRDGYENDLDRPITNLPTHIDYILMFHCPLEFVQKGLKLQYSSYYTQDEQECKVFF